MFKSLIWNSFKNKTKTKNKNKASIKTTLSNTFYGDKNEAIQNIQKIL